MMKLARLPEWITFDMYGTLIDTKVGYVKFWKDLVEQKSMEEKVDYMECVNTWGVEEYRLVQGPYKKYRTILTESVRFAMRKHGLEIEEGDAEGMAEAWGRFLPYPDVNPILSRLHEHCKLALITNVDNDIAELSVASIGIDFDGVFTAEKAGAYKPSRIPFEYALKEMGVTSDRVLHVAFGYKYDHTTAHEMGFPTVWINRRDLPRPVGIPIDIEMTDLLGLPDYIGIE
ncbi:MAG: haloacid dehalogenase type II [Anaerolineales bacterium]|nr:haloacid dehalogenase type II [Anaerolineales bacterium]